MCIWDVMYKYVQILLAHTLVFVWWKDYVLSFYVFFKKKICFLLWKINLIFYILCFALRPPTLPLVRLSESSDLSDPLEDLPRLNSDTALEAISGVQPELQNTRKDSQIYSKFYLNIFLFEFPILLYFYFIQFIQTISPSPIHFDQLF